MIRRIRYCLIFLLLPLCACDGVTDWADRNGPVLFGDRCEHWQCITESGQQQSDMNRRMREAQGQQVSAPPAPPPQAAPEPQATGQY